MSNRLVDEELGKVIENAKEYIFPDIKIVVSNENKDITLSHVSLFRTTRNFNNNISDVVNIEFLLPFGTFIKELYRLKDKLEVVIVTKFEKKTITKRYKGLLISKLNNSYDSKLTKLTADELDSQTLEHVVMQCVDPLTLSLKNITVSGFYHNLKIDKLLKGVMCNELDNVLVLGKKIKYYFNMYDIDNIKEYTNIHIRPNTKFIKLPYELQQYDYGIYDSGIGIYFSNVNVVNNTPMYDIYLYPLYKYDRYEKDTKMPKLLLIGSTKPNIDKNSYNSYYDDGIYKVIVNDLEFKDTTEKSRYDDGTGYIEYLSDINVNKDRLTITDDKIEMDNETTTALDYIDNTISDYAKLEEIDFDDNLFKYKSKLNKTKMILAIVKIPNINSEFIFPGMSIKYLYIKNDKTTYMTGIVHGVDISYDNIKKIVLTTLLIALERI